MSDTIFEVRIDYDELCQPPQFPPFHHRPNPNECIIEFFVPHYLESDLYIYVQLTHIYTKFYGFDKSLSQDQIHGRKIDVDKLHEECKGAVTNREGGHFYSINGTPLDPDAIAVPCGLGPSSI